MHITISNLAKEDLIDIWLYGHKVWGESLADRYLDGLYDRMRAIRRAYDMDSAAAKMLQLGEDLENYYAEDDGWENL